MLWQVSDQLTGSVSRDSLLLLRMCLFLVSRRPSCDGASIASLLQQSEQLRTGTGEVAHTHRWRLTPAL